MTGDSFHRIFRNLLLIHPVSPEEVGTTVDLGRGEHVEGVPAGSEAVEKEEDWTKGTLKDYEKYLTDNTDFALTAILKSVRDRGESMPFSNYAREWVQYPDKAAAVIRESWPKKPGLKAFVDGLEASNKLPDGNINPDFRDSFLMLQRIIAVLQERDSYLHVAREKREKLAHDEGPVSETIKQGVSNIIRNFQEGSTTDKIATVAILAVVAKALHWAYKAKLPGSDKYTGGSIMKLAIVAWAINAASAKMSKDGKSLLQRIDIGTPMEGVRGSLWSIFAMDGQDEGRGLTKPNEHQTMFAFATKNIRPIYDRYIEYTAQNRNRFSEQDLVRMGFSPQEAHTTDGETAFKVVDKLFRRAGQNYFLKLRVDEARKRNLKPEEIQIEDTGKTLEQLGHIAVNEKYLHGPLSGRSWTFEQVMVEEIEEGGAVQGGIESWEHSLYAVNDKTTIPSKVSVGISEFYTKVKEKVEEKGKWAKRKFLEIAGPIGLKYKDSYGAVERKILKLLKKDLEDEAALQLIQGGDMTIEVIEPGRARVMGYPVSYKKAKSEGKLAYTIEGVPITPFLEDTHVKSRTDLEQAITQRVQDAAKDIPLEGGEKLDFTKLEYDNTKQRWYLDGIKVSGNSGLGIPDNNDARLEVIFDDDGKGRFELHGEEITNMEKISERYVHGSITEGILARVPFLGEVAKGIALPGKVAKGNEADYKLRVTVDKIEDVVGLGTVVFGDIEGARFALRKISGKLEFFNPDKPQKTGGERVMINDRFREARLKQIAGSKFYHEQFANADYAVRNSGVDSDLKDRWEYFVQFKRAELLDLYQAKLKGAKTLKDVDKLQTDLLDKRLAQIEIWTSDFNLLTVLKDQQQAVRDFLEGKWHPPLVTMTAEWLYEGESWLPEYNDLMTQITKGTKYQLGAVSFGVRDDLRVLNIVRHAWSVLIRKNPTNGGYVKNVILSRLDSAAITFGPIRRIPSVSGKLKDPESW